MSIPCVIYDLEIQENPALIGWEDKWAMKISSGVAYSYQTKEYHFFGYTKEEHIRFLEFLSNSLCITFNGIKFDSMVLLGNDRKLSKTGGTLGTVYGKQYGWQNYDIYMEVLKILAGKNDCREIVDNKNYHGKGLYSLNTICRNTLGVTKNGDGALAPQLFKDKKYYELLQYNLQDVIMTKQLFEFIKKYHYIVNGNFDMVRLTSE